MMVQDPVALFRQIMGRKEEELADLIPGVNPRNEDIAGYRLGLGIRKPSQRLLLQQIFGKPDSDEEQALQQYFRIKRERI